MVPPGQLDELTVLLDGVAFPHGFAAAHGRMQHWVHGQEPSRIEGGPEQLRFEMPEKNRPASSIEDRDVHPLGFILEVPGGAVSRELAGQARDRSLPQAPRHRALARIPSPVRWANQNTHEYSLLSEIKDHRAKKIKKKN